MSRIGMIREVVVHFGGNSDFIYYADGPRSNMNKNKGGTTRYKIERYGDGLTVKAREFMVPVLAQLPGVQRAYINRGGHIVVVFPLTKKVADAAFKQGQADRAAVDSWPKVKDNGPTVTTTKASQMTKDDRMKIFWQEFGSDDAIATVARSVIESMTESAMVLCEDEPSAPIPDVNAICEMAADYAQDLISDFRAAVIDEIAKLSKQMTVKDESVRTVKLTINFND